MVQINEIDKLENLEEAKTILIDMAVSMDKFASDIQRIEEESKKDSTKLLELQRSVSQWSKKVSEWSENLSEAVKDGFTKNQKEVGKAESKTKRLEQTILNNERDNKRLLNENRKLRQELRDIEERTAKSEQLLRQIVKRMGS